MKFGVCRGLDDFQGFEVFREAGVDYLETGFGCLANYTDEKFKECKNKLDYFGIECIAANSFIPGEMSLVGNNVDYNLIEAYLDRGFERAETLGVKKFVLGSGKARNFPDSCTKEQAEEQLSFFLKEYAAPKARSLGGIVVLEPLRFCETNIIHTVSDAYKISKMSGCDNVFALADLYHVYGNNDMLSKISAECIPVRHSHIAEPVNRRYPNENGKNTDEVLYIYCEYLTALALCGCQTCSIEARTDNFSDDIKTAISFLKELYI